jgi:HD-like signal output (HDOD) protein/CheY-like chemotaxis protein
MMRVLFVDDDPNILQGLQRLLRPMRREWEMSFALGPHEAVVLFDQAPFDVVVSDMRMPDMSGAELLGRIRGSHPSVARIILSGQSQMESAVHSAGIAHQFLAKPCDADTLRETIARVLALRNFLRDPSLARLVAGIGSLPSLPESYTAINKELSSEDPSLQCVAQIISKDIAMSAKVLQLVNSAFFGLARRVETIEQAVTLLGTEIIKSLVLSHAAFSKFQPVSARFSAERLWNHSLLVGSIAAKIARAEGAEKFVVGAALQAGILHDLGQLILATHLPQQFDTALEAAAAEQAPLFETERTAVGATHAQVGAYLLGLWGLPDSTVEAVAFHHQPASCTLRAFAPLVAVHAADALVHAAVDGPDTVEAHVDTEFLAAANCAERLADWQEIVSEVLNRTEAS